MKKVLFIDRDGTLIKEPPETFQVDSLEKLEFMPKVFRNLYFIKKNLDYELVMVTNQDGLGTEEFPEEDFWTVQRKMLRALENEGITFDKIFIDRSLPEEKRPTRKPGTGMLGQYLEGSYDLAESFVIGDRLTDLELARNLGTKGILLNDGSLAGRVAGTDLADCCKLITSDWDEIYAFVAAPVRKKSVKRVTRETAVQIGLNLDGTGQTDISTGLGFFDHMLDQIGRHSGCDLSVKVTGDLHVDEHHTVEDTAIALGEVFLQALGDKKGLERYGFSLPMDDSLASVVIDFGGRPWLEWKATFHREKVGDVPTELFFHFFKSFSDAARCNLNIKAEGMNDHHMAEAIFKAFARAVKQAVRRDIFNFELPSTKGVL